MSPEPVDPIMLACCKPQFLKVARVIVDVATAFKVSIPMERLFVDAPKALEEPIGTEVDFIADRIKALVKAGNIGRWRYSEIRLPERSKGA